jgi:hypothetical protein
MNMARTVTALSVAAIFEKHSKLYRAPSEAACRSFATALMLVKSRPHDKKRLKPSKDARASAMALLRHIRPLRWSLAAADVDTGEELPTTPVFYAELVLLDDALKAVEALLPALDRPPIKPWLGNDPIRYIADKAQEAWAEANDGAPPTGKGEEAPLVKLVTDALHLAGLKMTTPWTVSAVLKGNRRPQ